MAFALPAASVPPTIVQKTRAPQSASRDAGGTRQVARREDHRRDRRDEQQLDDPRLGQRDVGADRVARVVRGRAVRAAAPGRTSLVAARRRRGPRSSS